jgi:hypothetical protein
VPELIYQWLIKLSLSYQYANDFDCQFEINDCKQDTVLLLASNKTITLKLKNVIKILI